MHHSPSQNKLSYFVSEVRKAQGAEYLETTSWRRHHLTWYLKEGDWGKARIQGEDRKSAQRRGLFSYMLCCSDTIHNVTDQVIYSD